MAGSGAVDDATESKVTDEVNINIRCLDYSKFSVQISLESTVKSFKEAIAQKCDISYDHQRLIYKGRILKNDQTLKSYGLEDGHIVHLVSEVAPTATTNTTGGTKGSTNSTISPSLMSGLMKRVVMQSLMNINPEIVRNLIMSPQVREITGRNPELAHILNDPDTHHQILEAARNPEIMREVMRNIDREMSNNESSPEVFNLMRHMFADLEKAFLNATTMAGAENANSNLFAPMSGTQGDQASNLSTNFSSTSSEAIAGSPSPHTSPLPNPWTSTRAGCAQNNTKRSASGGNAQAPTALGLDLLEPEALAGAILDLSLFTQLTQNSVISRTLQSIISNLQAMIQMLSAYAEQPGTPDLNPYLGPLTQNLEAFQRAHLSLLGQQLSTQESDRATGVQDPIIPSNVSRGLGSGSPAVPNSRPDEQPEQLYATQLSQLQEMGFSDTQENIRALTAASGDVHEAVKWLSGNSGQ